MYSISWPKIPVKMKQRICFMHEGNQLFGIVVAYNYNFTNLWIQVDVLSF